MKNSDDGSDKSKSLKNLSGKVGASEQTLSGALKENKIEQGEKEVTLTTEEPTDRAEGLASALKADVKIKVQDTPNPKAIKFIVNAPLKEEGKLTLTSQEQCLAYALPYSLFDIAGVEQLYLFENTLTLTHSGLLDSAAIKERAEAVIRTRLPLHDPYLESSEVSKEIKKSVVDRSDLSEELQVIEEILDRTVRPGLQMDGGDVEVIEFKDNILKILYQGACGGCPSAMMGTLDYIQNILRHELSNEEIVVVPI